MSFDLAQDETNQRIDAMAGTQSIDPSIFHNFLSGTAKTAMRGLAATGRTIHLLGAVAPVASDAITGGTEAQDRYFKEHDDIFNRAVDYWTPKPNEVGVAANIVGNLAVTLPMLIAAPELALPTAFAEPAEELVQKGVSAPRAAAVGSVQAAGQALGLWMPILGRTLPERLLLGAGSNVAQGVATRGASQELLKGTPASDQYHALEPAGLTLDAILGLAFGSVAHLSPSWREQSKEATDAIINWAKGIKPSELDAVAALRQAQHKNLDSLPGIPATEADVDAHVSRMNKALDQAAQNQPIDVQDIKVSRGTLPTVDELKALAQEVGTGDPEAPDLETLSKQLTGKPVGDLGPEDIKQVYDHLMGDVPAPAVHTDPVFSPDDARIKEANDRLTDLQGEAERVRQEEGLPKPETPETFERSPAYQEEIKALRIARDLELADMLSKQGDRTGAEARRFVADNADLTIDAVDQTGNPIKKTVRQFLDDAQAEAEALRKDKELVELAADCVMGLE